MPRVIPLNSKLQNVFSRSLWECLSRIRFLVKRQRIVIDERDFIHIYV